MTLQANNADGFPSKDHATRLFLAFVLLQFALHVGSLIFAKDPRMLMPHAVAYLHDLLLLILIWFGSTAVCRMVSRRIQPFCRVVTLVILFGAGFILAIYPLFLREYLAFPVNIFSADTAAAGVFLCEYLGFGALWPAALALSLGIVFLLFPFRIALPRFAYFIVLIFLVIVAMLTLPRLSPQPIVYSLQQELGSRVFGGERIVPRLKRPERGSDYENNLVSSKLPANRELQANHVLLIVMEGVTSEDFEKEFLNRKSEFYEKVKEKAAYFNQYFTTNLDSYTSLISMLTSVQVPYRAYADESLYAAVDNAHSLTEGLHNRGYSTFFISTFEQQPFVPTRSHWDRIIHRGDLPTLDGWVSLGISRMEAATEDRAALSTMMEFMTTSEKSFLLHELAYGHSPEWRAKTGITQLKYYDSYLTDLLGRLAAANLQSETLIVIVSDHGERSGASVAGNYRVPLLVTGPGVRPCVDDTFYSHMDLDGIVAHYLSDIALPSSRERIFVVGSTERWIYGEIHKTGDHLFIDDRMGRALGNRGNLDPSKLQSDFQAFLDDFGSRYGK